MTLSLSGCPTASKCINWRLEEDMSSYPEQKKGIWSSFQAGQEHFKKAREYKVPLVRSSPEAFWIWLCLSSRELLTRQAHGILRMQEPGISLETISSLEPLHSGHIECWFCMSWLQARPAKGKLDVFGNSDAVGLSEEVVCSHCGRKIAASRSICWPIAFLITLACGVELFTKLAPEYRLVNSGQEAFSNIMRRFAPHLEKCMGKGRNASRANMRRSWTSSSASSLSVKCLCLHHRLSLLSCCNDPS